MKCCFGVGVMMGEVDAAGWGGIVGGRGEGRGEGRGGEGDRGEEGRSEVKEGWEMGCGGGGMGDGR